MQVFDINLKPKESRGVDVQASYIYFLDGSAGGGDTTISVTPTGGGETVYLKPGQAYKTPDGAAPSSRWTLANLRGEGTIIGRVLMGQGEFSDNRVSGSVEVVDGAKSRTMAGVAFMGAMNTTANAGEFPYVQLWNPANSGRNIVLASVVLMGNAQGEIYFGPGSVAMANGYGTAISKRFGPGVPASVAQLRGKSDAGYLLTNSFGSELVAANTPVAVSFREPVVIEPGYGFLAVGYLNVQAPKVVATVEYFEDLV